MSIDDCPRQAEVIRAVLARRLGARPAGDELSAHAATCAVCGDALMLASAFSRCRDEAMREARVPAAGQVWWRAAVRAHAEAATAARRPLVWLLGGAAACLAGVVLALMQVAWPSIASVGLALVAVSSELTPRVGPLFHAIRPMLLIVAVVLTGLAVAPVLVYFALSDKHGD